MRLCDLDEIKVCVDRQYKNCHGYSGSKKAIYREAILAVKSILHSAKSVDGVTVQEWISVNDRLPEPEHDVILCTSEIETYGRHSEKKKIYRNIYMGYFDGDEWLTSYCYGCEYIFRMNEKYPNETIEVTHWLPLPDTPKENDYETD